MGSLDARPALTNTRVGRAGVRFGGLRELAQLLLHSLTQLGRLERLVGRFFPPLDESLGGFVHAVLLFLGAASSG